MDQRRFESDSRHANANKLQITLRLAPLHSTLGRDSDNSRNSGRRGLFMMLV